MVAPTAGSAPTGDAWINHLGPRRLRIFALVVFVAGSVAIYWRALSFPFLNYDDTFFVRDNPNLIHGFSWKSVWWALEANLLTVDRSAEYWMPITLLSRLLDAQLFGSNGGWFHLQGIVLHGLSAWLIFLFVLEMTGASARSALVGALFLVHPINTEVVCWIALRKDVLAGAASFLTILLYVRFARKPSLLRYLGVLLVFMVALLCKPSVVSLPLALLLLDWWPLGRLRLSGQSGFDRSTLTSTFAVIAEKIPFFIVALMASFVSLVGQEQMRTGGLGGDHIFVEGSGRSMLGFVDYLSRIFLLSPFCVLYPNRPWESFQPRDFWYASLVLSVITVGAVALAIRKYRPPLMGWLWFTGLLLPVSGFVQFGRQATADRYVYVPIVGLLILVVWLVADVLGFFKSTPARVRWLGRWSAAASAALIVVLASMSIRQSQTWRSDQAVWLQAMAVEPDSQVAFNNYATTLSSNESNVEETYRRASLKIAPTSVEQTGNLGKALARMGKTDEAIKLLEKALEGGALDVEKHRWLVYSYRKAGRIAEADTALARYEMLRGRIFLETGLGYLRLGEVELARAQLSLAFSSGIRARKAAGKELELLPPNIWLRDARDSFLRLPATSRFAPDRALIQAYLTYLAGDVPSATKGFGTAVERYPTIAEARWRHAICLAEQGRSEAAAKEVAIARHGRPAFEDGMNDWNFVSGEGDDSSWKPEP